MTVTSSLRTYTDLIFGETFVVVEVHVPKSLHAARSPGHGESLHLKDHGCIGRHQI